MSQLRYGDYSWCVKLPLDREGRRAIVKRFLDVGATFQEKDDPKWKFIMCGVNHIAPCIVDQFREVVSIDEAIKRLTSGVKTMSEKEDTVKADRLVEVYVKMRNKRAEMDRAHKDSLGELDEQMAKVLEALSKILDDTGLENMKTSHGTAFKKTGERVGVQEIEEFREFLAGECAGTDKDVYEKVLNNFPWHFFTKSVSKPSVLQYMKDNDGLTPEGIKCDRFIETQVRAK